MKDTERAALNRKYAIHDQSVFTEGPGGLVWAAIKTPPAAATVAVHGYANRSSNSNAVVQGLDDCPDRDKVDRGHRQVQDGPIHIRRETDRIDIDKTTVCAIEDMGLNRRPGIAENGRRAIVVWNPWTGKARRIQEKR